MSKENSAQAILATINGTDDMAAAIERLEQKRNLLEDELREDFHEVLEGLKPKNILKNTIHEVRESTPLKHNLLQIALGLGAGYFSRKMVVGKSAGLVKKALGTALQFGITKLVAGKNNEETNGFERPAKKKNIFKRIFSSI